MILDRSGLVLAPMEGVTDAPMREVLTSFGYFSFCVSEFIRVTNESLPNRVFTRYVPELLTGGKTKAGTPVLVQLLGGNAERLAYHADKACRLGAPGIDLNFGCPAPTVNRHDGGATLLKYPHRIREIVSAVRKAVPAPISVSAKLRLGWDNPRDIFKNVEMAVEGGASWVTLHARTRTQGYAPPVFWEIIGEVKKMCPVPVIANGDIWNFAAFEQCRKLTGCEHFMIGRGAMGNPRLSWAIAKSLGLVTSDRPAFTPQNPEAWAEPVRHFMQRCESFSPEPRYVVRRLKQWIKMASMYEPIPWFDQLKRCEELAQMKALFKIADAPRHSAQSLS